MPGFLPEHQVLLSGQESEVRHEERKKPQSSGEYSEEDNRGDALLPYLVAHNPLHTSQMPTDRTLTAFRSHPSSIHTYALYGQGRDLLDAHSKLLLVSVNPWQP